MKHVRLRHRYLRNSFIEQTPHWRACWMPMISMILRQAGVPRPRYAPAGFSVALCRTFARASSEYLPSGPRTRLYNRISECQKHPRSYRFGTYPPKVLLLGGIARASRKAPPKPVMKSFMSIWSKGLLLSFSLKISSVHFSSAAEVVACHYGKGSVHAAFEGT